MAEMTWTEEQKQVIESRNRNLLVSAAAGSGKTAVLVERIIRMITDRSAPVDIDRLLVMTFTRAAAAEMKERIGAALEKRLEESPGDENLERQSTLLNHARITTIDSFCLSLLREHFNELDLDPGFRTGDEGELMLLQADVMKELLEDCYEKGEERFLRFSDTYSSGRSDRSLEDYILQVWHFSQSSPWPEEWISRCRDELDREKGTSGLDGTEWMRFLLKDVRQQAEEYAGQLEEAIFTAEEEDGPQAYLPMLREDLNTVRSLEKAETYDAFCRIMEAPMFGRLAAVRGKQTDADKKEYVSAIRKRVKDGIRKMKDLYMPGPEEEILSDLAASREPVEVLLELAEEFSRRYQEAKKEKNLIDFYDMEHFALKILTGGSADHSPGPAADELSRFYEEILVDEYQDSNLVQEMLIRYLSRERYGTPNVFMVGDVKQSIYKFRLAKPELFLEKYESYPKEEGLFQKIELHRNFRSRPEVLNSVNDLFRGIMTKNLGNIAYTEDAALYPGASFPDMEGGRNPETELLLMNTGDSFFAGLDEERADYTAKEAEARLIASRIRELTDPERGMKLWDSGTGTWRPLRKKDVVVLLRSMSGWAEEFLSVFSSEGIPAFAESRTGYFSAIEVETVLNMLALVDNPMQDIPLAGVLRSPMAGMTDREISSVMAAFRRNPEKGQDRGLYGAVRYYLSLKKENEAGRKLEIFWARLEKLRREAAGLPVHELLYRIFQVTGYYDYVSVMPAGKARQANLNMLVEKAAAYEKTSYQGLFDFIRYIEKLKKYDTDFGEAARFGENEDAVRIMSIHKSKGLEFPVVFLAGAGKNFNRQDTRGKLLIDDELGIGTDYFDTERKLRAPTLKKNVLSRRMGLESLGEELRILYVAMTRAREKLIVTASDRYLENRMEKWRNLPEGSGPLPFTFLSSAGSCLEWFLMAASGTKNSIRTELVRAEDLLKEEVRFQEEKADLRMFLRMLREEAENGKADGEKELRGKTEQEEKLRRQRFLEFCYPHEADRTLHAKLSVSELKERGQFADDAESDFLPEIPRTEREQEKGPAAPGKKDSGAGGAFRGTAFHRALELLDFSDAETPEDVRRQLEELGRQGRMDREALKLVNPDRIFRFMQSDLAARMRKADRNGNLFRERQFVIGIPAREMDEADSDELVLIQGIVDAWFREEDGIVLVDYKTDRVPGDGESVLLKRYRTQMIYYARALSQITGSRVKEAVIYSLSLQKEIRVI